jgi:hypothetical protein
VGFLLLLLPFLLLTTSSQKLTALPLRLGGLEGAQTAQIRTLTIELADGVAEVVAEVRRTDVLADASDVDRRRVVVVPLADGSVDCAGLSEALWSLHRLDPEPTRVRLLPDDEMATAEVVAVLDAVRARAGEPLFPDVVVGADP